MKPAIRQSVFAQFQATFARRYFSFALCAVTAMALGTAGMCQTQPQIHQPKSAPAATSAAQRSTVAESADKGLNTGIKVHGHWVIEVRNPDGKVTARREFENSIQDPGATFLSALLAGNNSSGGLSVLLNGASTSYINYVLNPPQPQLSFSEAGPCAQLSNVSTSASGGTTCLITTGANSEGYATYLGALCLRAQANGSGVYPTGQTYPCSTNLTVNASTYPPKEPTPGFQLQGSVTATAPSAGNVNDVETVFTTCDTNSTPGNCLTIAIPSTNGDLTGNANLAGFNVFTERNLDGNTTAGAAAGDPDPVPYSPGQTISVIVTISFQ
jgi:hypothetical protein